MKAQSGILGLAQKFHAFLKTLHFQKLLIIITVVCSANTLEYAQNIPVDAYSSMQWRLVGPYRAGWATMAEGIPDSVNTFYFGAAGGGVWKTNDAGRTWQPLMQHQQASSIGALKVSPSNSRVIYVGTGQVALRYDILAGDGVYKSSDAGATWKNIGLKNTRHIGRIIVSPDNPNKVIVAALGHIFEPNSQRGVFLTENGGKSWKKVLYVNDSTGAVDLACDPSTPSVIYAALWQMHMHPWLDYYLTQAGPGSGIYKSTDGGMHWKLLKGHGLPGGNLGRIGLAAARNSGGKIIYASIISTKGKSGLYKSLDGGKSWKLMATKGDLADSYFSRITVDPNNSNIVYVMGRSIKRSIDGGKHFTIYKGAPGGDDYHFLWINPKHPSHMITAADQGCVVTVNNGKTWSSWYNQPTGQFYHLAVNDQFPYKIYSGQQDNGTVGILSRGPYGVIEDRDWHPVGGDERDYEVPKPGNPNMVFGSGFGGYISRFNEITRQVENVSPWPESSYGAKPTSVKYRYTWITPLEFSHLGNYPMYFGAQVLFRSTDDGNNWKIISPDLSGKVKGTSDNDNLDLLKARKAGYGVIFSIAPSPINKDVIWVGTDDGLIQLTTDNGKSWKNVTPPSVPLWARIDAISPSPFNKKAAYVAINTHRIGKFEPIILKTNDNGKTWEKIINGLPSNEYVNVVRVDPKRQGLLYAGTNRSVYVSFSDGKKWQPLTLNFPTTSVRDLVVHDGDLIAGTQGRGIWVLDDLEPLRELTKNITSEDFHLFKPAHAIRLRKDENHDTPWPPSTPLGKNPPTGAIIDYWFKDQAKTPVKITIQDKNGKVINKFISDEKIKNLPANRYFQKGWLGKKQRIETGPGMHRFVWNLRYPRPNALVYSYSIAAIWDQDTPLRPDGPLALPGKYVVKLTVNGKTYSQPLFIKLDPRVKTPNAALKKQLELALKINNDLNNAVMLMHNINSKKKKLNSQHNSQLVNKLTEISNKGKHNLSAVISGFANLTSAVQSGDAEPTKGQKDLFVYYQKEFKMLKTAYEKLDE